MTTTTSGDTSKHRSGQPGLRVLMMVENNPYDHDMRVRREAQALVGAGHQVAVIAPGKGRPRRRVGDDGVIVYSYPEPRAGAGIGAYVWEYGYSLVMMAVLSVVARFRDGIDVIHAHNPPDMLALVAAPHKLTGTRFVFDHHDLSPELIGLRYQGTKGKVLRRALVGFERLSCRLADQVIATNESHRSIEIERGRVDPERITVVRNGPPEEMRAVAPDPELRARAGTIIGYVGIMGPQDGIDYLLRAMHQLVHVLGMDDVLCVLVGKSDHLEELQALAAELDITDQVWFTGWVPYQELPRYLSSFDVCVAPDPSNDLNDRCTMIKLTEYMAVAKPTVAFDLPEHRVTAGDAALYAPANDEFEFAKRIQTLALDPEERERMGRIGRDRIDSELAWRYQAPKLIEAYERLR